jgi:DNA helicase HerA-like ATPase
MSVVGIVERLMRNNHDRAARAYLSQIEDHYGQYRKQTDQALCRLSNRSGYKLLLGESTWGRKINVPAKEFLAAHGLIQGGTGSGKSYYILSLISQLLQGPPLQMGFGVVDPKGELFQKIDMMRTMFQAWKENSDN